MKHILYLNQKFSQIIFFILLIFGLSISIVLKEFNLLLIPDYDLHILNIYRLIIIIFSINIFLCSKKKINLPILLLILINIIFLYNLLFSDEITFDILANDFYNQINVNIDKIDIIDSTPHHNYYVYDLFFINSKKYLLINIFNITLPLCVLLFISKLNFTLDSFKNLSLRICSIFLYALVLLIIIKFSITIGKHETFDNINDFIRLISEPQNFFFNIHGMIFILNVYFLLIIDKYFIQQVKYNRRDLIKIFLIFFCIVIFNTFIHLLICSITFFIYYSTRNKQLKYYFYSFIILSLIILLFFLKDFYVNQNNINDHGSFINSILIRIYNIKYFFAHSENFNYFIGNNIFADNIYTYPHNIFADILICTGITGLTLFLFFLYKLFLPLKNLKNSNNIFVICLLFQSFLFANLSGFFFSNTLIFIVFTISLIFSREKELKII